MSSKGAEAPKYTLDTNLFVDAIRDDAAAAALDAFLRRALAVTFLSSVVVQELRAGARAAKAAIALQRGIFAPFERRHRVVVPSAAAFKESGRILAGLGKGEEMIEYVEDRLGHDRRYSVDTSKVRALGWQPARSLDEALDATVRWYQDNRWWWQPLQTG